MSKVYIIYIIKYSKFSKLIISHAIVQQTFGLRIWVAIVVLIAVTPLLLSFMKTCLESRNTMDLISDNFLCIWGIFCQQALIGKDFYTVKELEFIQSNPNEIPIPIKYL